jgi:hypothetical protein
MPIRSNSPPVTTSGERRASRKKSFFFFSSAARSHPNEAVLATICFLLSSKATKMPASFP